MAEDDKVVDPKTVEQMLDSHNIPPEGSGLHSMLADFLPPEGEGGEEVDYIKEIEGLPEMDKINLTDFFGKDEWKPEDLLEMQLTDASTEKLKGLFPDIYTNGNGGEAGGESDDPILPDTKLEDMSHEDLIAEFKKQQGFADTRGTEITGLQKEIEQLKTQSPSGELEVTEDFKLLSSDFVGNYDRVRDKYNLPKTEVLKTLLVSGNDNARIAQWQQNELKGIIEKKHEMIEGEFSYDANEAADAKTASYDWDDMTARKRADIIKERDQVANRNAELSRQAESQQKEDYKWYADTYVDGNVDKVTELVSSMNKTITDITTGNEESTKHPFAMRNILRGFYFDELVQAAVTNAVSELNTQYAENQMYLPGSELPTDPTSVGGNVGEIESFSKDNLARSPMMSSMNFSLVEKKS